jgi:hypothetical protein
MPREAVIIKPLYRKLLHGRYAWSNGLRRSHSLLYTGGCSAERAGLGVSVAWWMGLLVFLSCLS